MDKKLYIKPVDKAIDNRLQAHWPCALTTRDSTKVPFKDQSMHIQEGVNIKESRIANTTAPIGISLQQRLNENAVKDKSDFISTAKMQPQR